MFVLTLSGKPKGFKVQNKRNCQHQIKVNIIKTLRDPGRQNILPPMRLQDMNTILSSSLYL